MAWSLIASIGAGLTLTGGTTSGINTTGADAIFIAVGEYTSSPTAPTDNKSNSWTLIKNESDANSASVAIYACYNPTVGAGHTFSTTAQYPSISVLAFSGAASATADQQNATSAAGSSLTIQPGSITPSQNNELVLCAFIDDNGAGITASIDSGFSTQTGWFESGVYGQSYPVGLSYLIQTTAGAINPTITWGSAPNGAAAIIASFKAASSGGGFTALFRKSLSGTGSGVGRRQLQG
ncbi:MAG TPA: hypothetical protein VFE77_02970 [Rhodanobacter sp.]|nr:hypothetical protein [Rhodanobacter sp.]